MCFNKDVKTHTHTHKIKNSKQMQKSKGQKTGKLKLPHFLPEPLLSKLPQGELLTDIVFLCL